jgi:ABC-type multidrug transport system permease subunit
MKFISVIIKSFKEQLRSFWVLVLTLLMGPFFILVYFLITESSEPRYNIIVVNNDKGIYELGQPVNHGKRLISFFSDINTSLGSTPFIINETTDSNEGVEKLKNKSADALIRIPDSFSQTLNARKRGDSSVVSNIEFVGDLTGTNYLISAVWLHEALSEYTLQATNSRRIVEVKEIPLGISAHISTFDMMVPGILIVSIIMLMFTASIAFVSEVENKTMLRLKLSRLSAIEFVGGVGFVQVVVGVISAILTLITAILLGFHYTGSLGIMIILACLTSLSLISFSLIIAAITKSANEVLIVGNFPMFLFMFFTGAAFPLKSEPLFAIAGYPITLQGLMTPSHAISALNKTLIMNMDIWSILPEILSITILALLYFIIGAAMFNHRHLKLT